MYTHTHTPAFGLLENSTCSSIWKLFREASNSIRAGLIAVASSQSSNHSVSQLAPALDSSPPQLCASSLRGNPFSATEQHLRPPRPSSCSPVRPLPLANSLAPRANSAQWRSIHPIVLLHSCRVGPPVTAPKKPFSQKLPQGTESKRTSATPAEAF